MRLVWNARSRVYVSFVVFFHENMNRKTESQKPLHLAFCFTCHIRLMGINTNETLITHIRFSLNYIACVDSHSESGLVPFACCNKRPILSILGSPLCEEDENPASGKTDSEKERERERKKERKGEREIENNH